MKWNDFKPNEEGVSGDDLREYKEQLKFYASESSKLAEPYITRQEAFKLDVFSKFQNILTEKGFEVTVDSPMNVTGKTPKINIKLWEEQIEDDHLILNFYEPVTTRFWGFGVYIEPSNPSMRNLVQFLGWYVNEKGELATFNKVKETVEFYKEEVKRAENLVAGKRVLAEHIEPLSFSISLFQDGKKLGNFDTFEKALDKAVELS